MATTRVIQGLMLGVVRPGYGPALVPNRGKWPWSTIGEHFPSGIWNGTSRSWEYYDVAGKVYKALAGPAALCW